MIYLTVLLVSLLTLFSCDSQLNLKGPKKSSLIPTLLKDEISANPETFSSDLILLVTDTESRWPDLLSSLKDIGIPTSGTKDLGVALKHKMILVYPALSGKLLNQEQLKQLDNYVKNGGTLLATNVLGGGLQEVFGYKDLSSGRVNTKLAFLSESSEVKKLLGPLAVEERTFNLKNRGNEIHLGSTSYNGAIHPMAVFEDKSAGLIHHNYGKGHSYALGLDLGDLAYLAHSARGEELSDTFVNHFDPKLDTFLHLIKKIYQLRNDHSVTLRIAPHDKDFVVLLTHDVDFVDSIFNAVTYAKALHEAGVEATFFIQTKYVKDFSEDIFFSKRIVNQLKQLSKLNMEVASHSVSHSLQFMLFPDGDGTEQFPDYQPFVHSKDKTEHGTILGELRISKFLLDMLIPEQRTVSFRSGHLRNPQALPQLLLSSGFRNDSSMTANAHLSHLPVKLSFNSRGQQILPVYRFPVTIEDEAQPPLLKRLPEAKDVCTKIGHRGGICTVLIHPNTKGDKVTFVKEFTSHFKTTAWFSTVEKFGAFWSAREKVRINFDGESILINSPETIEGLTLELAQNGKRYESAPAGLIKDQRNNSIVLEKFQGVVKLFRNRGI